MTISAKDVILKGRAYGKRLFAKNRLFVKNGLLAKNGERYVFSWMTLIFAGGMGLYFILHEEPDPRLSILYALFLIPLLYSAYRSWKRGKGAILRLGLALLIGGFTYAQIYSLIYDKPAFNPPFGNVEMRGWVVDRHIRANGGGQISLHPHSIEKSPLPRGKIIVYYNNQNSENIKTGNIKIGDFIRLSARFLPQRKPVIPGGYDPRLREWFSDIAAYAYARQITPAQTEHAQPLNARLRAYNNRWRQNINMRIKAYTDSEKSDVIIALITGYRGGIRDSIRDNLRISGLAHLLAISGLHMVLFAGGVFFSIRALLALFPSITEDYNIKKWSALSAIFAAGGYFIISGFSVATQRAFIMILIMFLAVLLNRPALTMRNVTLAGLIILIITPYHIMSANFHLSFMAVIALIAYYEWLRQNKIHNSLNHSTYINNPFFIVMRRQIKNLSAIAATTIIAGIATTPLIAAYFNYISLFGVISNLLAMPIMALIVMPMAPIILLLMPVNMHALPLNLMENGVGVILKIAQWVSQLPGAVLYIPAHSYIITMLICFSILWICLWQGRIRLWSPVFIVAAGLSILVFPVQKPILLIDGYAKQAALRTSQGKLAFLRNTRNIYVGQKWLRMEGDHRSFKNAAKYKGFECQDNICDTVTKNNIRIRAMLRKTVMQNHIYQQPCPHIIFAFFRIPKAVKEKMKNKCQNILIDSRDLRLLGTHSIFVEGGKIVIKTVRSEEKKRLWTKS